MGRLEPVQQRVGGPVWPCTPPGASSTSRLWSHFRYPMPYSVTRPSIRAKSRSVTPGRVRSSTCWCRSGRAGRPGAARTQSGWARASSESGLTISGSNHRPNCRPRARTCSTSGCSPSGHTCGSTVQSPRPAVSSRRPRNQPSSRTYRSTPMSAARSARARSRSRSWSKYTASHTLSVSGLGVRGCVGRSRTVRWRRSVRPSSPAPDQTK
jgi:hypothetical protein